MFQSITLLHQEVTADHKLRITFSVKDTCFSQDILLIGPYPDTSVDYYEPVAIVKVYLSRSLNVVRNLALYYLTQPGTNVIEVDCIFFDKHFSNIDYKNKYFKLVKLYHSEYRSLIDYKDEAFLRELLKLQS